MAESGVILPVDSTGKATRTETVTTTFTTGSGGVVHMPVSVIGDPTTPANLLVVDSSGRITSKAVDGSGNALTSSTVGTSRGLDVNILATQGGLSATSGTLSVAAGSGTTGTSSTTGTIVASAIGAGNATVMLSGGTYTALQLAFEACTDGSGTNWFPIDAARSDGTGVDSGLTGVYAASGVRAWNLFLPGYTFIRVRLQATFQTVAPTVIIVPGPSLEDPSPTVAPIDGQKMTYVASVAAMSTTIAGDVFAVTGSSSKTVRITRAEVFCVAGAATTTTLSLIKRSTIDTSGTTSSATVIALDSQSTTVTASATGYTVAPTLGTAVGPVRTWRGSIATTGSGVTWDFGNRPSQAPVLRGAAQQLVVNNGTAIGTSGSWNICIEWTEE